MTTITNTLASGHVAGVELSAAPGDLILAGLMLMAVMVLGVSVILERRR